MEDLICGFLHDEEQKDPENLLYQHVEGNSMLYVLTNEDKSHGASVFLCDTVQKSFRMYSQRDVISFRAVSMSVLSQTKI